MGKTGDIMNSAALIEAMVETGNQIDSAWSMYIVVHLGLFWFFFLVHRPLLLIERVVALFAYGGFAFINGNGLLTTYAFLEAIRTDLVTGFRSEFVKAPATAQALASTYFGDREDMIFVTHGLAFLIVALFLIFRNTIINRYEHYFPKHAQTKGSLLD
jgi:hypothetical protein